MGSLSWERSGETTGSIRYRMEEGSLVLSYRARVYSDEWQDVEERVTLERTPCNFGGERFWFRCPHCWRRVAVLYGADVRFLCRHCYRLPYASQNETFSDRMLRKARKIRRRLEAPDDLTTPVWVKPKGMHWRTFDRLERKERQASVASLMAFEARWDMLTRRLD